MIFRILGDGVRDAGTLRSGNFGGQPTNQWLDLLANADARAWVLESLPYDQRTEFVDKALSTIALESPFSLLVSSDVKPPAAVVQGLLRNQGVAHCIKRARDTFTKRQSNKQRKLDDSTRGNWTTYDAAAARKYEGDRKRKAYPYTKGRSSIFTK